MSRRSLWSEAGDLEASLPEVEPRLKEVVSSRPESDSSVEPAEDADDSEEEVETFDSFASKRNQEETGEHEIWFYDVRILRTRERGLVNKGFFIV